MATAHLAHEFGKLNTDIVVLTDERERHIRLRHPEDYPLFERSAVEVITNPDYILRDLKNESTVFMIARLDSINLNVVIRLSIADKDNKDNKNSVMTFFRLRDKNLVKLINRNLVLYSRKDL